MEKAAQRAGKISTFVEKPRLVCWNGDAGTLLDPSLPTVANLFICVKQTKAPAEGHGVLGRPQRDAEHDVPLLGGVAEQQRQHRGQ